MITEISIQKTEYLENDLYILREDMLPVAFGGNKVRIMLDHISYMRRKEYTSMIVYGRPTSNMVRAATCLCSINNLPCYIVYNTDEEDAEALMAQYYNAALSIPLAKKVFYCTNANVAETVELAMSEAEASGEKPYYVFGDKFGKGNELNNTISYRYVGEQIKEYEVMKGVAFELIVCPVGSGGTFAGIVNGHGSSWRTRYLGVSVARTEEDIRSAVRCFTENSIEDDEYQILTARSSSGAYESRSIPMNELIDKAYRELGLYLDPVYTGRAFAGLTDYIKDNEIKNTNILFVFTGSAPLYFDSIRQKG